MFRGFTGLARRTLRVASVASVASGSGFARGHGGPVNAFALANRMNLLNVDRRWSGLTPQQIDAMFANKEAQMKRDKELAEKLQREEAAKKVKKKWGGKKPPMTGKYALEAAKNAKQRKELGVSSQKKGAHVGGYLNPEQNEKLQKLKQKVAKKIVASPDTSKIKAKEQTPELGPRPGHALKKMIKKSKKKKRKMEDLAAICNPGPVDDQPLCLISPPSSFSSAPVVVHENTDVTDVWKDRWEGARKANLALVGWELFTYKFGQPDQGVEYVIVFSVDNALTLYAKIHLEDEDSNEIQSVKVGKKSRDANISRWGIKYSKQQLAHDDFEQIADNLDDLLAATKAIEEVAGDGDFGYDQGAALNERNYANRKCWYFTKRTGKSPPNAPIGNDRWKPREQSIPLRAIPT